LIDDSDTKVGLINSAKSRYIALIDIISKNLPDQKGRLAIARCHHAYIALASGDKALIDDAILSLSVAKKTFPGSRAHKAWLLNKLAQLHLAKGNDAGARLAILEGENAITFGSEEELKTKDGLRNIMVWRTGLELTKAQMHLQMYNDNPSNTALLELAEFSVNAVLTHQDAGKYLTTRKEQARLLYSKIRVLKGLE
jgi:hypothetical protein